MKAKLPESYIRVKLPLSCDYPSCPSGDTDYEVDYQKAINKVLPTGWQVVKQRSNFRPVVDSDGMSLLRIEKNDS